MLAGHVMFFRKWFVFNTFGLNRDIWIQIRSPAYLVRRLAIGGQAWPSRWLRIVLDGETYICRLRTNARIRTSLHDQHRSRLGQMDMCFSGLLHMGKTKCMVTTVSITVGTDKTWIPSSLYYGIKLQSSVCSLAFRLSRETSRGERKHKRGKSVAIWTKLYKEGWRRTYYTQTHFSFPARARRPWQ